ncbi:MAG: hypothetical protein IJB67_06255 [Firmicutes bacterium]|nr:hypothetical protein [Bacillota bacterium]
MKKGNLVHKFAGCNTPQGYISFAEENLGRLERVFVLLGAPGCGKSSMIKRVAKNLQDRGYDVELWQEAVEPESAAGVVIPQLGVAVVDAGWQQKWALHNPGVVEEICNLGSCWQQNKLRRNHREIKRLSAQIKATMQQETGLLAVYGGEQVSYAAADVRLSEEELGAVCSQLAEEIFAEENLQVRRFFAEVLTANGLQSYAQELSAACRRRFLLTEQAAEILTHLADEVVRRGHNVDLYYSFWQPDKLCMLILPQASVAVLAADLPDLQPLYDDVLLRLPQDNLTSTAEAEEQTGVGDKEAADIDEIIVRMKQEYHLREELAAYYTAAMDFGQVDKISNEILSKIWQMAAEREC